MQTTLMMAYQKSECSRNNFGKLIYRIQRKTETLLRKHGRIQI